MIRRFIVAAAMVTALDVSTARIAEAQTPVPAVCGDSLYQALKTRPIDSLSTREYEIFRDRDRACLAGGAQNTSVAPTLAGPPVVMAPADAATRVASGQAEGETAARVHGTAGWFIGGFGSGVLLGLIGTGVTWAVAAGSSAEPTPAEVTAIADRDPAYVQGYKEAYGRQLRSRRKSSALGGGLLGTAAFLIIYYGNQ